MALTPGSFYCSDHSALDFRAPPPSPVASGRRSCAVADNEVLTQFLQSSLKVPDLVLPDRIFHRRRQKMLVQELPELDFRCLDSSEDPESALEILDSALRVGWFEVINHGIPSDVIQSALAAGGRVFGIPTEMKVKTARSPDNPWGFEEDGSEEFVWCSDDGVFNQEMEGIWPLGYSNFREKLGKLLCNVGDISGKILEFLEKNSSSNRRRKLFHEEEEEEGSFSNICYIHKQWRNTDGNSLKYDVIRNMIRGCEFPHAFCVHFTNGASHFNVYSKKDWVSFQPRQNALIFTVGDRLQAWSGGRYKHVMGRPVFEEEKENNISMAILYSPPYEVNKDKELTISFGQQISIAILLIHIYQFLCFILR